LFAQELPIRYTPLDNANGGYSCKIIGNLIGKGKMTVQIACPTIVLKIERRYPIIVAAFELLMKICMKAVRET
jgi:hypothetical protein